MTVKWYLDRKEKKTHILDRFWGRLDEHVLQVKQTHYAQLKNGPA